MIIVSGTISVDPEDSNAFLALTAPCVLATRAEPGCTAYGFFADPDLPGTFRVYEEWADEDALNAHMGSEHMAAFLGAAGSFGISGTSIDRYDVTTKTKFM